MSNDGTNRKSQEATTVTVLFDHHDLFKGHIRLERHIAADRQDLYELHIGSRQIGFYGNGEHFYSEMNYSSGPDGLMPTAGHQHECAACAQYGIDSKAG